MSAIQEVAKHGLRLLDRNSPAILTGLGVAGVVSTAYLTGKAAYRSAHILKDYEEKENGLWVQASNKEKFDLVWRLYIPPVATGLATVLCIISAQSLNHARQAALISGLSISEGAYREYRDKNVALFGEKNDEKVRDEVARDDFRRNPPSSEDLSNLPAGKQLIRDLYSGRDFYGTMEDVKAARNDLNEGLINGDNYASLNDFYSKIGLDSIPIGDEVGWNITRLMDVNFTAILTDQGVACLAVGFRAQPQQDYDRYL